MYIANKCEGVTRVCHCGQTIWGKGLRSPEIEEVPVNEFQTKTSNRQMGAVPKIGFTAFFMSLHAVFCFVLSYISALFLIRFESISSTGWNGFGNNPHSIRLKQFRQQHMYVYTESKWPMANPPFPVAKLVLWQQLCYTYHNCGKERILRTIE